MLCYGFFIFKRNGYSVGAKRNNIFLIGPMGAGKSSVGKYLAAQLGVDFYDTDEEIEKRTGASIGWVFDIEGEEGFRKREEGLVAELVKMDNIVLATGGGTIISPLCREWLCQHGIVVYLKVSLGLQETRTLNESRRPLLQVPDRQKVFVELQKQREHLYAEMADFSVATDNRGIAAVANEIIELLAKY